MLRRTLPFARGLCTLFLFLALTVSPAWSQKPAPGSQSPILNPVLPVGVQRGQPADLLLTGTNLAGLTGVALGTPAEVTIPTADKNGEDNAKLKVQLKLPADTPLGLYALRLATKRGLSNIQLLAVDEEAANRPGLVVGHRLCSLRLVHRDLPRALAKCIASAGLLFIVR